MTTDTSKFAYYADTTSSPARNAAAITPSDSVDLAIASKAIFVGEAGDVTAIALDSSAPVTFKNCVAGSFLPVRVSRIMATAPTATNLVALY